MGMEPSIWAAIVTSVVSLIVALISLFGGRASERGKLQDTIRHQEIQNRLNSLHLSIQLIQKIKNELKHLLENVITVPTVIEARETIRQLEDNFEDIYASGLSSLNKNEGTLLHDLKHAFANISGTLEHICHYLPLGTGKIPEMTERLNSIRGQLTKFQEEYKQLRNGLVRKERI
jgi:uncharacterized phage infection (PIP) family protein YhgE